ncbi:MAG: amino acid adenylation domain-containing protein [Chloroflexi bacterium]|nr:amino acid adenylation domain-containing protein [Chloroflexota bacterium]
MINQTEKLAELPPQQAAIRNRCVHPSNTFVQFKKEEIEQAIASRFEEQVRKYPERLAVKCRRQNISYAALNNISNHLANRLLSMPGNGEEQVALLLKNDISMIASMLAVWKAGKICVPIDTEFPNSRINYMLEDSQAGVIITDTDSLDITAPLAQNAFRLINIDDVSFEYSSGNLNLPIPPETPANIMYTSGSTGQPKGIVHSHRNLLHNIMNYTNNFHICSEDKIILLHSYSFNSAMVDIWCALLNGATLFPWQIKQEGIADLPAWLAQEGITIFSWSPTPFRELVETLTGMENFSELRVITLGGEPVSKREFELYKKHFPNNCIFVNRMGTTETNNFRLYFLDRDSHINGNLLPVGYGVSDKHVLLLNESNQLADSNSAGEIAVQSPYLALGYWRRPELTEKVFLPDPTGGNERIYLTGDLGTMRPDGCLEHLGRKDFQVKIRGYRIEISEVETALIELGGIKETVVVSRKSENGEEKLIAYIVPVKQALNIGELRAALSQRLPDYMIPSVFVSLETLPLTPTGKIDHNALPSPSVFDSNVHASFLAPRDETEYRLSTIWEQVLDIQPIGIMDNFFALGGHSLSAMRLLVKTERIFNLKLPQTFLLQFPTIEQQAKVVRENPEFHENPFSAVLPINPNGSKPPIFFIPGIMGNVFTDLGDLSENLGPDQPFYGLQDGLGIPAKIESKATYFLYEIRKIQAHGPYLLGGVCSGALTAYEIARQLTAQGEKVALLALIEPVYPWISGIRSYMDFASHVYYRFTKRFDYHTRSVSQLRIVDQGKYFQLKAKLVSNMWALRRYSARGYHGFIHIFSTRESLEKTPQNFQAAWNDLENAGAKYHEIPGTHNAITGDYDTKIEKSLMQAIAEQLRPLIDNSLK